MDVKTSERLIDNRIEKIRQVLTKKGEEYAPDTDRLHNFKRAAQNQGITTAAALWGMANKHLVSIQDMISNEATPDAELASEKIGDLINYLILLELVYIEEREKTLFKLSGDEKILEINL